MKGGGGGGEDSCFDGKDGLEPWFCYPLKQLAARGWEEECKEGKG